MMYSFVMQNNCLAVYLIMYYLRRVCVCVCVCVLPTMLMYIKKRSLKQYYHK